MKKLLSLVIAVAALAVVPVAFGEDNPPPPSIQTTPSGQTQGQGQQGQNAAARFQMIRMRVMLIEKRFAKRCGTAGSTASQECKDFATKAADRLATLDTRLQALITKRQQAGGNVDPLTKLDTAVQALIAKIHTWLGT